MLELSTIRENTQEVLSALEKRGLQLQDEIQKIINLDDQRKGIQGELDDTLSQINSISKEIGQLFQSGQTEEANQKKDDVANFKAKSKDLSDQLSQVESEIRTALEQIPNQPHSSVPSGTNENDNEVVFQVASLPDLPKGALPHWDLAQKYDIIDFETGVKITGAGFPLYKGKGAKLQRALIHWFLDSANDAGYLEIENPLLVNASSAYSTGQLPDKEGQMYMVEKDDLFLIPTAEVPLTNIYRDDIISESELPIKLTGYTPCFRREAGSYGKDVRGLNRLHQFDKVEIVQMVQPETSYDVLDAMKAYIEQLLVQLQLPYRILRLCGGDLGFTSALTFDFETYSAAQGRWLEVSSVSNFETYQSNRARIRYRPNTSDGSKAKTQLVHTLNGSALALPRILASILENNQTEKGIKIPEVLIPYTKFDWID